VRSSVKAANDILNEELNEELTGRTCEVWRPRLGRDLSRDEAKQIASSVTGFFAILAEWSRADVSEPANDNGDAATSDEEGVCDDR
jgi:hypothetical protein